MKEKLIKNTAWNSLGVMTYFACQWLITVIVVWLYDDYTNAGYLALAMTITNFFTMIAIYNVRVYQVSDIKEEFNDSEYVAARILTCVASILFCAAFIFITDFTAMQRIIIICYMVFRANEAFIDVLHGIDQKNWRMDHVGVSSIARGFAMLSAFALLGWLFGLLSAIIGMAVITILIGLIYDLPKTKKLARFSTYQGKQVLSLLKRCFPLFPLLFIFQFSKFRASYSTHKPQ